MLNEIDEGKQVKNISPLYQSDISSEFEKNDATLIYYVANLQGIGTCETQEDSFTFINALDFDCMKSKGLLAIVADGMGGMTGGKLASDTAVNIFRTEYENYNLAGDITKQLCQSALHADRAIYNLLNAKGGSTVIACVLYNQNMYFISAGDSALYLKRNGNLLRINREQDILHEHYLEAIRENNISIKKVNHTSDDHALSQFLGCGELDDPDCFISPMHLYIGDTLLICSDGISDVLTSEEINECMEQLSPDDICASLEKKVWEGSGESYRDNYTALVIRCTN